MTRTWPVLLLVLLFGVPSFSQGPGERVPSVALAPVGKVQVKAGEPVSVELAFRIGSEFHINSNKPKSELLIPTVLKLAAAEPVSVVAVKYPPGQDVAFPFAPNEKLSVYSGDFAIIAILKAPTKAASGEYPVTGELRFQACDRSACYPPRSMPVKFSVTVVGR